MRDSVSLEDAFAVLEAESYSRTMLMTLFESWKNVETSVLDSMLSAVDLLESLESMSSRCNRLIREKPAKKDDVIEWLMHLVRRKHRYTLLLVSTVTPRLIWLWYSSFSCGSLSSKLTDLVLGIHHELSLLSNDRPERISILDVFQKVKETSSSHDTATSPLRTSNSSPACLFSPEILSPLLKADPLSLSDPSKDEEDEWETVISLASLHGRAYSNDDSHEGTEWIGRSPIPSCVSLNSENFFSLLASLLQLFRWMCSEYSCSLTCCSLYCAVAARICSLGASEILFREDLAIGSIDSDGHRGSEPFLSRNFSVSHLPSDYLLHPLFCALSEEFPLVSSHVQASITASSEIIGEARFSDFVYPSSSETEEERVSLDPSLSADNIRMVIRSDMLEDFARTLICCWRCYHGRDAANGHTDTFASETIRATSSVIRRRAEMQSTAGSLLYSCSVEDAIKLLEFTDPYSNDFVTTTDDFPIA